MKSILTTALILALGLSQTSPGQTEISPQNSDNQTPLPDDCVEIAVGQPVANKSDAPEPGTVIDIDGTAEVTITLKLSGVCIKAEGQVIARSDDDSKEKPPQNYKLEIGIGGSELKQELKFSFNRADIKSSKKWKFILKPKDSGESFIDDIEFEGKCDDCGCEVTVKQGCFLADLFTPASNGGMTKGTLYFYAPDFTFPGRAGLTAILPPSFAVTRDTNGRITKIATNNAGVMEIQDGPTQDAITITYKDANNVEYHKTMISLVDVGGNPRFRLDSTRTVNGIAETTTRNEQYKDSNGATVLLKGQMNGTTFEDTWREILHENKTTPGIEIRTKTSEERSRFSDPWEFTSSTEATWEDQIYGWVMTKEVIDPDRPGHTGEKLTSTWAYYQPGEITGPSGSIIGLGKIKQHVRYDGYESFHTYGLHHESVTTPYAGTAAGKTVTITHEPTTNTTTSVTTIGGQITAKTVSKNVTTATSSHTIQDTYTAEGEKLTSITHYKMDGNDFILKPSRIQHHDGTLTTYNYTRLAGGGYTTETDTGASSDGITVSRGTRTTTTVNNRGTTILEQTTAIGYGTGSAVFSSMAVTSIDSIGRALTTAYYPETVAIVGEVAAASNPAWTTTTQYNCCGISSETDMYGIPTYYAYDGQKRSVKSNTLGVTTEIHYNGLTTETHRYPETVTASLSPALNGTSSTLISKSVSNLSGTLSESWSPDPTSSTPGALVKSTTTTIYKPADGLSTRTVSTTPDNFSQTTDSFLDGNTFKTYGELGATMQYAYSVNATGEVTSQSYLDGTDLKETTTTQTDWAGRTLSNTFMDNSAATMEYNAIGQMVKSTDPDGITTLYAYNPQGEQIINAVDLNNNSIIDYGIDTVSSTESDPALDGANNPVMLSITKIWQPGDTSPNGGTLVSTTMQSPNGLSGTSQSIGVAYPSSSFTTLSGNGNYSTTSISPDGTKSITTYSAGLLTSSTSLNTENLPLENMSFAYDPLNRAITTTHSRTGTTTTNYLSDTADIVTSITDPENRTTAFTYDLQGRQISVNAPDTLDADGNTLANITTTSYFPDGSVAETNGDQTYRVSHTYDYADRQLTMTTYGTETATTTWIYSPERGFLTRKQYADGKGTDYTYTPAGRLLTRTWGRSTVALPKVTEYSYDQGGRLVSTNYSDTTPDVSMSYDSLSRPVTQSNGLATSTFTYNPSNLQIDKETITYNLPNHPTFTRIIDRSQDTLGRDVGFQLKTENLTLENSSAYDYHPTDGRLHKVLSLASPSLESSEFTYNYLHNSNLIASIVSPAHTVTNVWEANRNVLVSKENKVGNTQISKYSYGVNYLGQRTTLGMAGTAFQTVRDITWGYNSKGEIVKAEHSTNTAFNRAYQFDGIGNRLEGSAGVSPASVTTYTPNALNQYTAINNQSSIINPQFDHDGNLTSGPLPANVNANSTLIWDVENRLIEATVGTTGSVVRYSYDAQSRRIAETVGSETTIYVYDGWNPVAVYNATYALTKTYTWGMDLSDSIQGAGGVGGLLAVSIHDQQSSIFYPTYDGNGNVSEYLDSTGAVAAHYEYDPFGKTTVATGLKANDFAHRFSTKPLDATTGLYYYGFRWYDSETGRWLSRDIIEEDGGINLYGFTNNSATNSIDYLGFVTAITTVIAGEPEIKWDLSFTDPYLIYPGGNKDTAPSNANAISLLRYKISPSCICKKKGTKDEYWILSSLEVTVYTEIHLRSTLSGDEKDFSYEKELEHSDDFKTWSQHTDTKNAFEKFGAFQSVDDKPVKRYTSEDLCKSGISTKLLANKNIIKSAKDAVFATKKKWDKKDPNTGIVPHKYPGAGNWKKRKE